MKRILLHPLHGLISNSFTKPKFFWRWCCLHTTLSGFLKDRLGNHRFTFICSCVTKVLAYVMYSINLSEYFPLFGRLIDGLSDVGLTVLLGQIALQPNKESRAGYFVLAEGAYCLNWCYIWSRTWRFYYISGQYTWLANKRGQFTWDYINNNMASFPYFPPTFTQ